MKITITYKDDVFRVYKGRKKTYTRQWLSVGMRGVNLPLSSGLTFLLITEAEVQSEDVKKAIAALLETGTYSFNR